MAFVRTVKTASGATPVQIAERVAGRDRVLEHLGSAHTDADLAALQETAWGLAGSGNSRAGGVAAVVMVVNVLAADEA